MSEENAQMHISIPRSTVKRHRALLVALTAAVVAIFTVFASAAWAAPEDFSFVSQSASISTAQAGAHPDFETVFIMGGRPTREDNLGQFTQWSQIRNLAVALPPGMVGNPSAYPHCSTAVFAQQVGAFGDPSLPFCPTDSQVGVVEPGVFGLFGPGPEYVGAGTGYKTPLFNLDAPGGNSRIVARLGFIGVFYPIFIDIKLDPKRDDALTATVTDIPATGTYAAYTKLWAVPSDASHDVERLNWIQAALCGLAGVCPKNPVESGLEPTPFMANPTSCGPAEVSQAATSYQREEGADFGISSLPDIEGCEAVPFGPTMSLEPTTRSAGASSGLEASLHIPQEGLTDPEALVTSHLKEATVSLPEGFSLNASAADGLGSCSPGQIGIDRNERQIVDIGAGGAPVALSFDGQNAATLPELASASEVQAALEGLPNIGPGDVAVKGRAGGPWTVDFAGGLSGRDVPSIGGVHSELLRLAIKAEGGTYTLGYQGEETAQIPFDADAAAVREALEGLAGIGPGNVEARGERVQNGVELRIAFTGALSGADISEVTTTDSLVGIAQNNAANDPANFARVYVLAQGGSAATTHTVKQGGTIGFDDADPACPESSKVATGEIHTPVLGEPLRADFYLAKQSDNPYNSLFAGYLVARGAGVMIKVPAKIDVDPGTGQVVTTFTNNPQQPFEDLELHFKGGNRGLITTPDKCGTYASTYELTPWSGNPPVKGQSEFTLDENCQDKPFAPGFHAGSETALGGSFTTFATQVTNDAGAPALRGITVDLPEGLSAKLAGISTCPDGALAALPTAPGTGAAQIASPSCPANSQIGTVQAGAGSGSPFYVRTGKAYLAGPYKGAPLSLAVLTPAVAGPFDLGNVLVRVPVSLDRRTARAHAASDPIPTMLSGIPLELRDIRVLLDRQGFVLNPTDCAPKSADGLITGEGGASANVSDRFQVGECAALGFKPKLALKLRGGTQRGDHPALTAVFRPRPGDANASYVQVALPKSEFLDQAHIGTVCTRVQFDADACPAASIYGKVTASTPLLDSPLTGNVYLRSSSNKLPDLVMDLRGPASQPIHLEADGRIDSIKGGIRTTFEFVPDAPITKVTLKMKGGKKGILQNSRNICAASFKANASLAAHNGRTLEVQPEMQARCKGAARKGKGKGKGHAKHHG